MIQITPDAANKLIRSYKDERRLLMEKERVDCTYSYLGTEQPYIPDYDFKQTQERLEVLSDKIIKIKHALNQFNMKTVSPATDMTIDEMLVRMASRGWNVCARCHRSPVVRIRVRVLPNTPRLISRWKKQKLRTGKR